MSHRVFSSVLMDRGDTHRQACAMRRECEDSCKDVKGPSDIMSQIRQDIRVAIVQFEVELPARARIRHKVEACGMHKRRALDFSDLDRVIVNAPLFFLPCLIQTGYFPSFVS